MDVLGEFQQAAADPKGYARNLKQNGKPVIGCFCSYAPVEIIFASGAVPVRLFGTSEDISLADAHLQAYCCSLVRGGLEDALAGRLDYLDGTVFPHTCDSIQRLSDIWRLNTNFGFFADVVLPVKLNTDASRDYLADVLAKFRRELGQWLGRDITDEALQASIKTYNAIRSALKDLYALRSENPGLLRGSDLLAAVKGSMVMDPAGLAEKLQTLATDVRQGRHAWDATGRKRLTLAGGVCDQPDIYRIVENSGGVVVGDDLCTGSRWFDGLIDADGDPLLAIAKRYIDRPVCPAKYSSPAARGENLVRAVRDHGAEGVLFLLLKFCDPHSFDYPYMKEFLDRENIPSMLYEIEDQLPSEGQLATRFETFIEML